MPHKRRLLTYKVVKSSFLLNLNRREVKTCAAQLQQEHINDALAWQSAKPFDLIPTPPKQPLIGHMQVLIKGMNSQHKLHKEMQEKYGDIVQFSIPGQKVVCLYGPERGKEMYANEGKYPVVGGFENIEFIRYRKILMPKMTFTCNHQNNLSSRNFIYAYGYIDILSFVYLCVFNQLSNILDQIHFQKGKKE